MFAQDGYDLRVEWGAEGVAGLGRECAVLVIVDVLSFSTTVDLVTGQGGRVRPVRWRGGRVPRPAAVGPDPGLLDLPSPNGATLCAAAAGTGATVLVGCLRNATAAACETQPGCGGAGRGRRIRHCPDRHSAAPGTQRTGTSGGEAAHTAAPVLVDDLLEAA